MQLQVTCLARELAACVHKLVHACAALPAETVESEAARGNQLAAEASGRRNAIKIIIEELLEVIMKT